MSETHSYETMWPFWLDDACYQVARGVRYLALPSEMSRELFELEVEPEIPRLQEYHGVLIRGVGDDEVIDVQVAAAPWVFKVLDTHRGTALEDAVIGALLGYDARKIQEFIDD